ncbi:hypothetical protein [Aerobium aerolatum]|uniref:DUF4189 domain-containing protein n=1 Tax=Aquamicrobium aerolatum DSM 21857 TaxID=1121003 RepID=A0A1I3SXI3_9HYPH|nr:hypothetical protein [Aquamicrobium aerolatum]SFJ62116.1 hypothetical protein SAMN03080618_03471 [Aquamicrobium aerolatum DSM 21857]
MAFAQRAISVIAAVSASFALAAAAIAQDAPLNSFAAEMLDKAQQCARTPYAYQCKELPQQFFSSFNRCRSELNRTLHLSRAEKSAERLEGKIEACGSYLPALRYISRDGYPNLKHAIKDYTADTQKMLAELNSELGRNAQLSQNRMQRPDDARPYAAISADGNADSHYRIATGPSKNAAELKAIEQCRLAYIHNNCRINVASAPLNSDGYFVVVTTPYHTDGARGMVKVAYTPKDKLQQFLSQNALYGWRYDVLPLPSR